MKTCAVVFGIITLGIVAIVVAIAVPETIANYHATQTSHATATAIAHDVAPTPGVALPTMTADQRAYFGQISERVNTLESSVANFQQLMQDVTDTPALRFDATWKGHLALVLASWQEMYNAAKDVTNAPPGLDIINGKWIETLGHLNLAADHYAHGLDSNNPSLFDTGSNELQTATDDLNELEPMIQYFADQHG